MNVDELHFIRRRSGAFMDEDSGSPCAQDFVFVLTWSVHLNWCSG